MKRLQNNSAVFIFFFLYFLFRFWFLSKYSIELDETISYFWSRSSISNLTMLLRSDIHPPLNYLVHAVFDFDRTEIGVRWFYFIVFLFSLLPLKKIVDEFLNNNEKIYFWLVFLFSSFIIQRTTVARMHAFSFSLSLYLSYFFFNFVNKPKTIYLFWVAVISCLFVLNFYPSIIFPFWIYIVLMYECYKKDCFKKIIFSFSFYLFFTLVTIYTFYPGGTLLHFNLNIPTGFIFPYTIFSFVYSEEIIYWGLLKVNGYILGLFFLMMIIPFLALYRGYKVMCKIRIWRLYLYCGILSFLVNFLLSFFIPKLLFSPKYLIYLYPAFVIVFIKGLSSLDYKFKRVFLAFYFLYNAFSVYMMIYENKEDWRKVSEFLLKNKKQNEFVISEYLYPICFYYPCDDKVFEVSKVNDILKVDDNFWLIYSNASRPKLMSDFIKKFKLKKVWKFGNMRITYFKKI